MARGYGKHKPASGLRENKDGIWQIDKRIEGRRVRFSTGTRDYAIALRRLHDLLGNRAPEGSIVDIRSARVKTQSVYPDEVDRFSDWERLVMEQGKNRWLRAIYSRAIAGAKSRSIPFALSFGELQAIALSSGGACQISAIPFDMTPMSRNPFAPSLDRIDSTDSYHIENCRLVCLLGNMALNSWGDDALYRFAEGFVSTHREATRQHMVNIDPQTRMNSG